MNSIPEGCDKRYLVKVIAKTEGITNHAKDSTLPPEERVKRVWTREELAAGARTLSLRPINMNHQKPIAGAHTVFSKINEAGQVEVLCYIPDEECRRKILEDKIKTVSIEEVSFDEAKLAEGLKQEDIVFTGLALVEEPYVAGDPNTSLEVLYEGWNVICEVVGKVQDESVLIEAKDKELQEKTIRITELETAVTKLQENVKNADAAKAEAINQAVKEAKTEVISKVEAVLPQVFILRNRNGGLQFLTQNVKKALRECQQ